MDSMTTTDIEAKIETLQDEIDTALGRNDRTIAQAGVS